jgi:hypothetical protein
MSQIIIQDVYPDNGTTSAAVINNNSVAITAGANTIDGTNVRVEGIDQRNVFQYAMIQKTVKQYNGYQLAGWPALPAAGAWYPFYTEASPFGGKGAGIKEWPINHDSTGATNAAVGAGTKLLINEQVNEGDIIRFRWMINLFDIQTANGSNGADASSQLIFTGARPMGGANGSGVGEWCALVYPKINLTSAALLDANFVTVGSLGNIVVVDPATQIPGPGSVQPVTGGRFDHCSFIPEYIMSAGNAPASYAWSTYLFDQMMIQGEFWMRAHITGATTLYGVQLYFSGPWRMDTDGAVPAGPGLYLENVDCDPSVPHYGVSGTYGFERAYIEATIYRNTAT